METGSNSEAADAVKIPGFSWNEYILFTKESIPI